MEEKQEIRSYFNFARAAAILGIFFYHIYDFSFGGFGSVGGRFAAGLLQSLFANADSPGDYVWGIVQLAMSFGNKGVEIFIAASGFGLYLSHLRKKTPWLEFYKKRAIRVLPLYWATCLTIAWIFPRTAEYLVYNLLLVQIFTRDYLVFGPLWFISYLFLLYLLFPIFVLAFRSSKAKWGLFAASFFLTPLWTGALGLLGFKAVGIAPTEYMQVFLLGMLIADSVHRGTPFHKVVLSGAVALGAAAAFAALVYIQSHYAVSGETHRVFGILLLLSLPLFYAPVRRSRMVIGAADRLAYVAYALYLFHPVIFIKALLWADSAHWLSWALIYPMGEFVRSPMKFISASLVLLAVALATSFAVQKAYDMLTRGLLDTAREKAG